MSALEGGGWNVRPVQPTVGHGCPLCVSNGTLLVCTERCDKAATCQTCGGFIEFYDSPHGSWWSHLVHPADGHDAVALPREQKAPHEFACDEDRQGEPREGLICGWCGVTEAEMQAASGRLDLCGFLPSERWDEE